MLFNTETGQVTKLFPTDINLRNDKMFRNHIENISNKKMA